ncbi:MAG: acetyl-CoA C-acyltransferase [Aquimonas sp.]|jgi:3-oxoadipyl-CoA thiolase|nr:acetyl-CoA C-acyltransferase [Aquimonas sp.]
MTEVFVVDATRTPFARHAGALASIRCDDLAALPLQTLVQRHPQIDWSALDDVVLGCANQAGEDNRNVARIAALLAGLPVSVPGMTVNRLCASGLESVAIAARAIRAGEAHAILAGGVESMSRAPYVLSKALTSFAREQTLEDSTLGWRFVNPAIRERWGVDSMAQTAQNLATRFGIERSTQDAYALRSQQRAEHARQAGIFAEQIQPVTVADRVFNEDEHPRPHTTAEQLARLRPLLGPETSITAGNASGINDGAAALLLASPTMLERWGVTPLARIVASAAVGVEPRYMGIGPVPAIEALLARTGWMLDSIDHIEINEAFAAQVVACTRGLRLADDDRRVNPYGGAIALGHPLGASGARLLMQSAFALRRGSASRAVVSLCVGAGQGVAMALEALS